MSAPLSTTLESYRQPLFTAISTDPVRWLNLSITRPALSDAIQQLAARKADALERLCTEVEREPFLLTIELSTGPAKFQGVAEFNTCFIVSAFCVELARQFHALDMDRKKSLKRATIFKNICKDGDEYMPYAATRRLVGRVMPSAVETLEEDFGMLKDHAKDIVEDVVKNELMLDMEAAEIGYLTCVKVGKEDLPWNADAFQ